MKWPCQVRRNEETCEDRASDLNLANIYVCVCVCVNKNLDRCGNHLRVPVSQMEMGKEGKKMRVSGVTMKRSCDEEEKNEEKRKGDANSRSEQS